MHADYENSDIAKGDHFGAWAQAGRTDPAAVIGNLSIIHIHNLARNTTTTDSMSLCKRYVSSLPINRMLHPC